MTTLGTPGGSESHESVMVDKVELDPATAESILERALTLDGGVYEYSLAKRGKFLEAVERVKEVIAGSPLAKKLDTLKSGQHTALVITGVPQDPALPPAPLDGTAPEAKETFVSEGFATGVAEYLGIPSMLLGEKDNALVHQITPVEGAEEEQSNEGTVRLRLHQDLAPNPDNPRMPYQVFMPDYLILTGVQKGSGETYTSISAVDDALKLLSPGTKEVLQERRFVTNPPDSFVAALGGDVEQFQIPTHAILTEREGHMECAFDSSSQVRPLDPEDTEAAKALMELEEALASVRKEVLIAPGTSVAFNNRRIVHGRGAVVGEVDTGEKRWIQRVYVFDGIRVAQEAQKYSLALSVGGGLLRVQPLGGMQKPPQDLLDMAA